MHQTIASGAGGARDPFARNPPLNAGTDQGDHICRSNIKYRADIDGIRAMAVILVVLFHARIKGFEGGFLGVDIFFVISGYLITSLIYSEMDRGEFSLLSFYERRIRRLFPALFLVIFVVSLFTFILFFPDDLYHYGRTVLFATLFVSNILFWYEASYFDAAASTKPLLHTWSLAVEEQFYIVFPLFLALSYFYCRRWLIGITAGVLALSFTLSVWGVAGWPSFAFYSAPTRAWELLLGSMLALGAVPPLRRTVAKEIAAVTGIALIAWSVVACSESTPFPGLAAVPPCLGAALLIHSGAEGETAVGRILRSAPFVAVGLISYSLYLWHWPILVLSEYAMGTHLRLRYRIVCVGLAFILASASWWLVERPIRRKGSFVDRRLLFSGAGATMAVAASLGLVLLLSGGLVWRYPEPVRHLFAYSDYPAGPVYRHGSCFITPDADRFQPEVCLRTDPNRKNYLLVGDSHAAHLWIGLSTEFTEINFLQANASGCRPVVGGGVQNSPECLGLVDYIFSEFLPSHKVDAVLLSASWYNDETDVDKIEATVDHIKMYIKDTIIFGPIALYSKPLPYLIANSLSTGSTDYLMRHKIRHIAALDERMHEIARAKSIRYISVYKTVCPTTSCEKLTPDGVPLQWDQGHLTAEGSALLARAWRRSGELP